MSYCRVQFPFFFCLFLGLFFVFLHFASLALIAPFLLHCKGTGNGSVSYYCSVQFPFFFCLFLFCLFFAGIDAISWRIDI